MRRLHFFLYQSFNAHPNQTENKPKQVEIRVIKMIVDSPQVESFDGAGSKSQSDHGDEISIQPRSFKTSPFKNQSINTSPPDAKQTENHFTKRKI